MQFRPQSEGMWGGFSVGVKVPVAGFRYETVARAARRAHEGSFGVQVSVSFVMIVKVWGSFVVMVKVVGFVVKACGGIVVSHWFVSWVYFLPAPITTLFIFGVKPSPDPHFVLTALGSPWGRVRVVSGFCNPGGSGAGAGRPAGFTPSAGCQPLLVLGRVPRRSRMGVGRRVRSRVRFTRPRGGA